MNAVEFVTDLSASPTLTIPATVAAHLPKSGRARVLLLTDEDPTGDVDAAYEQGYARIPEDVTLPAAMLPHLAADVGEWE